MDAEKLFRKLRPIFGSQLDALWLQYQLERDSRGEIEELLQLLAVRHLGASAGQSHMLLPPPSRTTARGSYELGTVLYAGKEAGVFGLREKEWIQHVAIFGRAGSGKTNVGFLIFRELLRHGKPVWVFDWKRNYRDFVHQLDIPVLTVGRPVAPFGFNPLEPPPGSETSAWLKKLVEILSHVYGFRQASSYVLQRALYSYCEQCRREGATATFGGLRDQLEQTRSTGREGQWLQSARRVIGTLCFGPVGKVLMGAPADLPELLNRSLILELDALTDTDKTFVVEALLLWVHHYRMQQPGRELFKHAMLIEEAHHILLKHRQSSETVMDVVLREIRELGESVILLDQHPSLVSPVSLGNTYCTIAMNLKHGSDTAALAAALQLDEEAKDCLGKLPVGTALVRLQGRWPHPFIVKFPKCEVEKGSVDDATIAANVGYSASGRGIPSPRGTGSAVPALRDSDEGAERTRDPEKSPRCIQLLADCAGFPLSGVAERYPRLRVSAAAGTHLKEEAISRGWLRAGRIRLGNRSLVVLALTTAGVEALIRSDWRGVCVTPDDRASTEHEAWKAWLFCELRSRGISVEAERTLVNGHRADLVIGSDAAIEVETGKSQAAENVALLKQAGINRILIVTTSKTAAVLTKKDLADAAEIVEAEVLVNGFDEALDSLLKR